MMTNQVRENYLLITSHANVELLISYNLVSSQIIPIHTSNTHPEPPS